MRNLSCIIIMDVCKTSQKVYPSLKHQSVPEGKAQDRVVSAPEL